MRSPTGRYGTASGEGDSDVDILFMLRPRQKRTTGAGLRRSKIQSGQRRARQGRSGRVQVEASAGRAEIDGKGNKRWCRYLSLCVIPIMVTSSKVANACCCVS